MKPTCFEGKTPYQNGKGIACFGDEADQTGRNVACVLVRESRKTRVL